MKTSTTPSLCCLGIDVSKDTLDACLLQPDQPRQCSAFTNNTTGFQRLLRWVETHNIESLRIGLEATGSYSTALLYFLTEHRYQAALLNPRRVKDYSKALGQRIKTDKVDAEIIARFIQQVEPRNWTHPSQEISELQSLMRRRAQLVGSRQAACNRKHALAKAGLEANQNALDSLDRESNFLTEEINSVMESLKALLKRSVVLQEAERLLCSIPGIGRVIALTILSEIPFITSFGRAREVASFAGLTPRLKQSGTSLRSRGSLTKEGSMALRKQLYMAALNVARRDNSLRPGYEAMIENGKPKMVAICALMHKLLRVAFGVLKHRTPFVENFAN